MGTLDYRANASDVKPGWLSDNSGNLGWWPFGMEYSMWNSSAYQAGSELGWKLAFPLLAQQGSNAIEWVF